MDNTLQLYDALCMITDRAYGASPQGHLGGLGLCNPVWFKKTH